MKSHIKTTLKEFNIKVIKEELDNDNDNDNDTYSTYKGFLKGYQQRKQDFISSIESFNDLTDDKIHECLDYFGYEGFNDEEEAFEEMKNKVEFYQQMSNPIILYRIIGVKNKKMIRTDELGAHYTPHKWNIDGDTLLSIGYENWDEEVKPYVMEVSVPHSEIDVIQTIIQNLSFPNEHEINLKNKGKGAKFVRAYKLFK